MNNESTNKRVYVPAEMEVVDFPESDVIVTSGEHMGTDNEDWD